MNFCACLGPREGSPLCYCQLKNAGLPTTAYEWSQDDKDRLNKALEEICAKNRKEA